LIEGKQQMLDLRLRLKGAWLFGVVISRQGAKVEKDMEQPLLRKCVASFHIKMQLSWSAQLEN